MCVDKRIYVCAGKRIYVCAGKRIYVCECQYDCINTHAYACWFVLVSVFMCVSASTIVSIRMHMHAGLCAYL